MRKNRIYSSPYFTLSLTQLTSQTKLHMQVLVPIVNTRHLPHTYTFLEKNFPEVLRTQCFNDLNLPFRKEVKATEMGHLFEHILLVNICQLIVSSGRKKVVVNGVTEWNWMKEPEGVFHILVDIGKKDFNFLVEALKKTIELFERLFGLSLPSPAFAYSYIHQ